MFALAFLIGHGIGDFMLQPHKWAMNKFKWTLKGWIYCFIHSVLYAAVFTTVIAHYDYFFGNSVFDNHFLFMLMIFLTHFPIDKFSLGKYVMKAMGRKVDFPDMTPIDNPMLNEKNVGWIVYVVIDNTMHFILMFCGIGIFFPELV